MGEHRSAGSVNARRAAMQSVPVEGLAWFVELILAIGLLTACTAGLTFSFGVEILPWSLYGLDGKAVGKQAAGRTLCGAS
jgi:hypothetical protein